MPELIVDPDFSVDSEDWEFFEGIPELKGARELDRKANAYIAVASPSYGRPGCVRGALRLVLRFIRRSCLRVKVPGQIVRHS